MLKIGVDIEDIERFRGKSQEFLDRIFTENEQKYCKSFRQPQSRFCARFCAKEAVVKALSGFGVKDVRYREIEVFHDENGCPCIKILKELPKNFTVNLSISHEKSKAIAFVTIEEIQ